MRMLRLWRRPAFPRRPPRWSFWRFRRPLLRRPAGGGEDSGVSLEARGVVVRLSRGFDEGTLCRVMGLLPGMPPC